MAPFGGGVPYFSPDARSGRRAVRFEVGMVGVNRFLPRGG